MIGYHLPLATNKILLSLKNIVKDLENSLDLLIVTLGSWLVGLVEDGKPHSLTVVRALYNDVKDCFLT